MARKSSIAGRRKAWDILRLTLLWARKGRVFRNRLIVSLNVVQKGIKKLGRRSSRTGALIYGDREFSFGDSPLAQVKMIRGRSSVRFKMPHIPCIEPQADFDHEFEFDGDDREEEGKSCEYSYDDVDDDSEEEEDEGIDLKAERFIAKFYEQMKLQRQISHMRYNES